MVHFFQPETGFHLTAHSEAPAGAGISGSSALAIALIGALNKLVGDRYDRRQFIGIAANIETTVIKVPAGLQDYYPAFYGSTSCIHLDLDGVDRERLAIDESEIERRFVICYTGEPRHSGINNWGVFKRHIDRDADVFTTFERIRDADPRCAPPPRLECGSRNDARRLPKPQTPGADDHDAAYGSTRRRGFG